MILNCNTFVNWKQIELEIACLGCIGFFLSKAFCSLYKITNALIYFYRHISCETFCARKIENLVTNIAKSKYCHFYFIKTVIKYYLHFRMRKSRKFNQTKHFACKWLYSFKRLANKSWFLFLFSEFSITKRFVSNERNL